MTVMTSHVSKTINCGLLVKKTCSSSLKFCIFKIQGGSLLTIFAAALVHNSGILVIFQLENATIAKFQSCKRS